MKYQAAGIRDLFEPEQLGVVTLLRSEAIVHAAAKLLEMHREVMTGLVWISTCVMLLRKSMWKSAARL
jgi:hypothetical protein